MKFLRNLLASCLGTSIAIIILIFFGFVLLTKMASSFADIDKVTVKGNTVLEINLGDAVKDYALKPDNIFDELFKEHEYQLSQIINAIENAKNDDNIKGISIKNLSINAGIAQTQTIREKLVAFKTTGKFITAYADFYTQKNYYLSSVADSIYVTPYGGVDFKGLSSERLFYKDFQDKYGVKMEVIRHGKYKSAVEGYLDNKMSDANREQISSFLNSIWSELIEDVAISRNKTVKELNLIADDLLARNSTIAIENNMLDGAIYIDQYEEILNTFVDGEANIITLEDYIDTGKGRIKSSASNKIAVLYAQGTILYGKGDETYIGQESMIKAIRKIRDNDKIKAVVLRVNSPGGVALTADLIWRELEILKKEKPLVVSMGNLAASGGYYIACNADVIYAEPTTITGSIGVFGTIPNFSELAGNIGINAEQVVTNKNSMGYSPYEPMTKDFYDVTKEGVEQVYTTFLNRVATGRNMTFDEVDAVAQGRVWTGKEALEIGLVDVLGNMDDAIEKAAELADISDYKTTSYPRYKKDFEDSFKSFPFMNVKEKLLKEELGEENYKALKEAQKMSQLKGIQMLLPYDIDIR
ncbi:MAG: signal peptide peptidase SppA [Flavobacteriaceae bacterium]|nr:signal peptide peptidase SppA [Flavobacteriaceae bacterium]